MMSLRDPPPTPAAFVSFGQLLRYLRRRAQLTQRELALAAGCSTTEIARLEHDQPSAELAALAVQLVLALRLVPASAWASRLHELAHTASPSLPAGARASEPRMPPDAHAAPSPRAAPLLMTKLYVPRARPTLVVRPRLIERLHAGLIGKLTLIAAPAGFGKTTLLAEWLHQRIKDEGSRMKNDDVNATGQPSSFIPQPSNAAWVALDAGDNDPTRFWTYVIAALDTLTPGVGASATALLQSPQPPPIETVLATLLNALSTQPPEKMRERPDVLVLDDYHMIAARPIHQALTTLIDYLPPHVHLVIASRTDPPMPLARWRVRGALAELRANDLRFTPAESAAFLSEVMGLPLTAADSAALEARTEGWIAGLQLGRLRAG
jgi:LuxR family maltose regulon positive regulatory protein